MFPIKFINVEKKYSDLLPLFQGVNFTIAPGEFVFLTGRSGTGKTTVLKLIHRIEAPSSGKIFIGKEIETHEKIMLQTHRQSIGFIFQDYKLLEEETVYNNVILPLQIRGLKESTIKKRVNEFAAICGLDKLLNHKVITLSGGEKQLAAIARAAIASPKIILADEPTANLDPTASEQILELLQFFQKQGVSVIVATHDINLIRSKLGRIMLISERTIKEVPQAS